MRRVTARGRSSPNHVGHLDANQRKALLSRGTSRSSTSAPGRSAAVTRLRQRAMASHRVYFTQGVDSTTMYRVPLIPRTEHALELGPMVARRSAPRPDLAGTRREADVRIPVAVYEHRMCHVATTPRRQAGMVWETYR